MGGAQAGLTLIQADQDAKTLRAQAKYQEAMFEINAGYAELQGKDALHRGEEDVHSIKSGAKQLIGSQRASLAAQGIEVDSGSALEIQQDTAALAELDSIRARNNAWREAWGYKVEAQQASAQGQLAAITGKAKAQQTLLTGGITALNQGYSGFAATQGPSGSGGKSGGNYAASPKQAPMGRNNY